ncbi:NAD-dependent protein deacylase [Conexibacter stalactiti]|uniref:protein acetyllysine N-acetyltransferase n=1 Tax=Conexibacter stalactiti TaxID=1940611 RepID=A0ABU4HXL8_9ACTN|nr:NAD-dependent protein deacylase [Conexibacter stalactiti]MDW5598031.1 NAD-dependent protein deacylase [Conexibacter stalactiti]MEC5038673.1 NAD-dependent protein deacylase [Conexibacter stalactiti]
MSDARLADDAAAGVALLAARVRAARSVVVLTGAGISVPSGIPDFRTPRTGLWANVDPMEVAHVDAWRSDPARFWAFYGHRFQSLRDKRPNRAHELLVELERRGLVDAVVTQNIDRLHGPHGELIELHGSIASSSCQECGAAYPLEEVQARLDQDPQGVPRCDCGRPLKPDVVLFGEFLPQAALERAQALAVRADLLLCVGSSLEVWPVGELPALTLRAGGEVAIVTQGPTRYDDEAVAKLDGDVVEELEALLRAL